MKTILEYWERPRISTTSELKFTEIIEFDDDIQLFEKFYKKNNQLRYCNGSYYKLKNKKWEDKYKEWLKSEDYQKKSFNLYYGNGIVD